VRDELQAVMTSKVFIVQVGGFLQIKDKSVESISCVSVLNFFQAAAI